MLKENLALIKAEEARVRTQFGVPISITNYDSWTDCPNCTYNDRYKGPSRPNCQVCSNKGKIPSTSTHAEQVFVDWVVEDKNTDVEAGLLKAGDAKVKARIEAKSFFENAIQNKILITIDGNSMLPVRQEPSIVGSCTIVYCTRSLKS